MQDMSSFKKGLMIKLTPQPTMMVEVPLDMGIGSSLFREIFREPVSFCDSRSTVASSTVNGSLKGFRNLRVS